MGDVADEHELKHGTRQEGVYFGSYSFSQKCTGALGNFMAGVAIDLIGLNPNSKVGEVPQDVLNHFGASYGLIALLIVAAIWVFLPYSLNSKRHAQVLVELAKRRPADAESVPGMPRAEAATPRLRPADRQFEEDVDESTRCADLHRTVRPGRAGGLRQSARCARLRQPVAAGTVRPRADRDCGLSARARPNASRSPPASPTCTCATRTRWRRRGTRWPNCPAVASCSVSAYRTPGLNTSRGHTWQPPLKKMTAFLDALDKVEVAAPAAPRVPHLHRRARTAIADARCAAHRRRDHVSDDAAARAAVARTNRRAARRSASSRCSLPNRIRQWHAPRRARR